jgi:hypothetical protein
VKDKRGEKRSDSYFAVARRRRNRYIKIIIIPSIAAAIALGVIFVTQAQENRLGAREVVHLHPQLSVVVDGKPFSVPQNVGISPSLWKDRSLEKYGMPGMSPLHTHDDSGLIHVESNANRNYTLGEFLNVWGGLDLNGKTVKATVDGKPVSDYSNIILKDGEKISLNIS